VPQTAIFIATPADKNKWSNVLNNLHPQARSPSAAIERLSETVWQLRLAASPAALGHLISACEQFGIAYRISNT
jgi:hypothetical protein